MADLGLLKELCSLQGISGEEENVRQRIIKEISAFADTIKVTPLGNIVAFKKGKRPANVKLMLIAHMDEVGMTVTHITDEGFLQFATVGGIDRRVLCGKPVTVGNGINGVIGAKPIHLMDSAEREKSVPVSDLYIDIGAKDEEDAKKSVSLGDPVYFHSIYDDAYGTIKARAIDDRAGCVILIDLLKSELEYDMTFVFSVQEEIGLRGAKTAAYEVDPQAAIVVETTTAADISGIEKDRQVCHLGQGPVVSFMDRSTIYDKEYYQMAFEVAREKGIACQTKQAIAGGNDAGAVHISRSGVRTIAVSLACRYLHSAMGLISQEDFHAAEKLVGALAEKIAGQVK